MAHEISIYRNGIWTGTGRLVNGSIRGCDAILGADQDASDDTYDLIEEAIDIGNSSVTCSDGEYTWKLDGGTVCGNRVQIDRSGGQGHCWQNIDSEDLSRSILDEIEGEMIDGGKDSCEDYVTSDGMHYRWQ